MEHVRIRHQPTQQTLDVLLGFGTCGWLFDFFLCKMGCAYHTYLVATNNYRQILWRSSKKKIITATCNISLSQNLNAFSLESFLYLLYYLLEKHFKLGEKGYDIVLRYDKYF